MQFVGGTNPGFFTFLVNGVSKRLLCDQFAPNVTSLIYISSVATLADLSNTQLAANGDPQALLKYQQVAILDLLAYNDPSLAADVVRANRIIVDGQGQNLPHVQQLLDFVRAQNPANYDLSGFKIYTSPIVNGARLTQEITGIDIPTVQPRVMPPVIAKAFGVASLQVGGGTSLTFTLTNPNNTPLTGVNFTDILPTPGIAIASPNNLSSSCGGTVSAVAGSNFISLANGVLAANGSCVISLNVIGTAPIQALNITSVVGSNEGGNGNSATATIVIGAGYLVNYAANLTVGDSVINITNTGGNGSSLNGPGLGGPTGNICVNVYAFSPDEQMLSCCSCLLTPNSLASLSIQSDILSNTLTPIRPNSVVIKILATATGGTAAAPTFNGTSCTNSAALQGFPLIADGVDAWGTTLHALPPGFALTDKKFLASTLSAGELASLSNRCANTIGNGSSFGICRACRNGGLGADRIQ